ncbi:MAG: hypothetical protein JKY70_06745 [Mucilaginibacter sp.]|nr:hypothetical protein [Mucilaginibacter sp.]
MEITDLNGKVIEVDDLDLALMQADDFRHYRHTDNRFTRLDEELNAYWEDVYNKLWKLRTEQ